MKTATAKARPIMFSGPMVQAILAGKKTMTRRVVKPQPRTVEGLKCPYGEPGETLWVRESFEAAFKKTLTSNGCVYRADYHPDYGRIDADKTLYHDKKRWTSPLFMPRWASRLTLEIVSVRVERLQEITEADAHAEGFEWYQFSVAWQEINGKKHPWTSNPWVWVIEFRKAAYLRLGGQK